MRFGWIVQDEQGEVRAMDLTFQEAEDLCLYLVEFEEGQISAINVETGIEAVYFLGSEPKSEPDYGDFDYDDL